MVGILVVDDERALRDTLSYSLRKAGFEVRTASDGAGGLAAARMQNPDLILLDVLLPGGMDGFEVCRLLRQELHCPIVLISALADEVDRVVGLEVGADDYVTKPFSITELVARIKAHLRRAARGRAVSPAQMAMEKVDPPIELGPVRIDVARRMVEVNGSLVDLNRREFDLLYHLARHPGVTLSRPRLLDALWPDVLDRSDTRAVDVCVHRLRERIEDDPTRPRLIHTIRGLGYALRPPPAAVNVPLKTA